MVAYGDVGRRKIDLTALGVERGNRTSSYFCTPKGAKVWGWEGVDGIHFCSVKELGNLVFSVNPMAGKGDYVHPVAENFEDFLRLLAACGHASAIEQIHGWNQQEFDRFLKENPVTSAQKQVIDQLNRKLGIAPMEQPFEYVKNLQASFDYGKIPWKKREWNVYYNGSFWDHHKARSRPGTEIKIEKQALWGEETVYIPSVYVCTQGLGIDFLIEVDFEKEKAFLEAHKDLEEREKKGGRISQEEREQIELENPLELGFQAEILLNGRKLRQERGCGLCWVPKGLLEDRPVMPDGEDILNHYGMDLSKVYRIDRGFYQWATKRKPNLRRIAMKLCPEPKTIPGIHFQVTGPGQKVTFSHPVTGIRYTLTVRDYGWQQIEMEETDSRWVCPKHCAVLEYEIDPVLTPDQMVVGDCQEGDRPYLKQENQFEPTSSGCSAIAVIGGGVGMCQSGGAVRYASSGLYFEPQKEIEWRLSFRIPDRDPLEISEFSCL